MPCSMGNSIGFILCIQKYKNKRKLRGLNEKKKKIIGIAVKFQGEGDWVSYKINSVNESKARKGVK